MQTKHVTIEAPNTEVIVDILDPHHVTVSVYLDYTMEPPTLRVEARIATSDSTWDEKSFAVDLSEYVDKDKDVEEGEPEPEPAKLKGPPVNPNAFYVTTFCNFAHRLRDGAPLNHECYVIPPIFLERERAGHTNGWGPEADVERWRQTRRSHPGIPVPE